MWNTDVRTAAALGLPDDTLGPPAGPNGSEGKVGQERGGERAPEHIGGLVSSQGGSNPQPAHTPAWGLPRI